MWCKTFHRTYPPTFTSVHPLPEKTFVSSHSGFMMHVTHELIPVLASPLSSPAPPMSLTPKHHIRRFAGITAFASKVPSEVKSQDIFNHAAWALTYILICYHLNTVVVKLQNLHWVSQDFLCCPDMNNCSLSITFCVLQPNWGFARRAVGPSGSVTLRSALGGAFASAVP